jgi:hypothetical protein
LAGSTSLRPFQALTLLLALVAIAITAALSRPSTATAEDCAFPFTPTTYEDLKNRKLFLDTIELAAFDMLFPGDPFFGLPEIEYGPRERRQTEDGKVPPVLLKSIAWIESSITQAGLDIPFGAIGPALVSFDCGHGITQVTSGMTVPTGEAGRGSPEQALVATHFAYNIARGAVILASKWNEAPETRPVAGKDTNGHPGILENWYFALWGYNGFTGPGANRSNHPMDPIYGSWPRAPFSCGPTGDGKGHNRGNYPYQELVYGCATNPPVVDGKPLWQSQAITLPDLNNAAWKDALKLTNFVFPYAKMDIPTAQPFHVDSTEAPAQSLRAKVLGSPKLGVSKEKVKVGYAPDSGSTVEIVDIENDGTGVLAWYAIASVPWIKVTPYTGSAVGDNLPCDRGAPCDRRGHLEISVDATKAPAGRRTVQVTVMALGSNQTSVIDVEVSQVVRVGVPGISRH